MLGEHVSPLNSCANGAWVPSVLLRWWLCRDRGGQGGTGRLSGAEGFGEVSVAALHGCPDSGPSLRMTANLPG